MGYQTGTGKWESHQDLTLSPAAPVTADVNVPASGGVDIGERGTVRLELDVTAVTGTSPTLDVTVQTSKDGTGTGLGAWRTLGTFAQKTAAGSERKSFGGADKFIRAFFDVGGTSPSFTCTLKGEAVG